MLQSFLFALRRAGLGVSVTEWLDLVRALEGGHAHCSAVRFYQLGRALLIKKAQESENGSNQ